MRQHEMNQGVDDGFHAVQGATATRSGTTLLVEAYAAIWVILMLFVWRTNSRQRRLEERLEMLSQKLDESAPDA